MMDQSFFAEAKQKKILYAIGVIWLLEAGMNALYGYRRGGGGVGAALYACVFLAIAFIAAWLPVKIIELRRDGAKFWGAVLVAPLLLCVIVSQAAGWSVMGVTMADGQAKREDKAMQRDLTRGELARAERDLAAITETAPAASLEKLAAEAWAAASREEERKGCKQLCEAKKKEAAAFEERLGKARRRDELGGVISGSSEKLAKGEAVSGGSPEMEVLARITSGDPKDVQFWSTVALVGVIGFFANFGFAIVRLGGAGGQGAPLPVDMDHSWAWRDDPAAMRRLAGPARREALPHPYQYGFDGGVAPLAAAQETARSSPPSAASSQPINIHFGAATAPAAPVSASPQSHPAPQDATERTHPDTRHDSRPREAVQATPAGDQPVRRDAIRALNDHMLAFKAACVIDQDGSAVPAARMYERYQRFPGARQISREAFETMFPELTGVEVAPFGGAPHYFNVALREASQHVAVVH